MRCILKDRGGFEKPRRWVRGQRQFFCCWETASILNIFISVLDNNFTWKTDKEMCGRGPHYLKGQIWRASLSCKMEMKTWHVWEFLILHICFNSRLWPKHRLTAFDTERKTWFSVLSSVWPPARSLEQEPGPGERQQYRCWSSVSLPWFPCTDSWPYMQFRMQY